MGQVAVSVAVLACGLLFVRSLVQLSTVDLGFQPDQLLMASVDLDLQGYEQERALQLFERLADQVEALPGVASAAIGARVPFDNFMSVRPVSLSGAPGVKDGDAMQIGLNHVDASYFETLGVTLLSGRGISQQDDQSSLPVAVVNETLAQRLWPGQDPIGKSFRWQSGGEPVSVIGLARNGKYHLLGEAPRPFAYLPIAQSYSGMAALYARSETQDPLVLAPAIRETIRGLDAELPVFNIRTMDEHLRSSALAFLPLRIGAVLAGAQGLIALFLAVLGVYGVVASSIAQRTRDVGIRIAMGAQKIDIFRVVARSALRPAFIGLALGITISFGLARLLRVLLYGLDPASLPMFAAVFVFVLAVALFACWLPARRTLKMDPMTALRHE
jgi:predicted permease